MENWSQSIQQMIDIIDRCIRQQEDEALTLRALSAALGYSESYVSRKFRALSGMSLRDYLRFRHLAFALRDVRDTSDSLLEIAVRYGFSSHEAFTRAFRAAYGVTPSAYRLHPTAVVLHTILKPFDCYLLGIGGTGMATSTDHIKTYFITIPAHKFLHIRNYESIGYFDFWQKQSLIPGQDWATICGLLERIPGSLDHFGGNERNASSGQLMAYINEPTGRLCSWGIPLAEAYGIRLPADYAGEVPAPLQLMDVPEGEYVVFEHGPFDYETENTQVEAEIERAMKEFDYAAHGVQLDTAQGRVFYFYHDCTRFWKYVRPVKRVEGIFRAITFPKTKRQTAILQGLPFCFFPKTSLFRFPDHIHRQVHLARFRRRRQVIMQPRNVIRLLDAVMQELFDALNVVHCQRNLRVRHQLRRS